MTSTFKCASCAAPLEFKGEMMQKCDHCGSTVIAPSELFYQANKPGGKVSADLIGDAVKIAEIQKLLRGGNKIGAIKLFRETFGSGLKEAKDAVESMERGESLDVSHINISEIKFPEINVDGEAVRRVGMRVGGVLVAVLIVGFFVVAVLAGVIIYFATTRTAGSASSANSPQISTQTPEVKAEAAPPIKEILRFGGDGDGGGYFKDNRHVAVDGNGTMYSSDYSPMKIQAFDKDGKFKTQWVPEAGVNLYGLVADKKGDVYIANDRGLFKYEGETGKLLSKNDQVMPRSLSLGWDGNIVAASGRSIVLLDPSLKVLREAKDAAEQANSKFGFDHLAAAPDGSIYALDRHSNEVCKFDQSLKFIDRFGSAANSANAIVVDAKGRIFIADTSSIRVFSAQQELLLTMPAKQAFGLAFDSDGALYMASRPFVVKYSVEL